MISTLVRLPLPAPFAQDFTFYYLCLNIADAIISVVYHSTDVTVMTSVTWMLERQTCGVPFATVVTSRSLLDCIDPRVQLILSLSSIFESLEAIFITVIGSVSCTFHVAVRTAVPFIKSVTTQRHLYGEGFQESGGTHIPPNTYLVTQVSERDKV